MGLGDVQNINARTLDTQAVFQQAISASELALRQAEKNLASERTRQQSLVAGAGESMSGESASLDLENRVNPEKQRRYRLAWKAGSGPGLELEPNYSKLRPRRLDLNA